MEYNWYEKCVFSSYARFNPLKENKKKPKYMVPTNAVSLRWEDLKTSTSSGEFTHFLGLVFIHYVLLHSLK